MLNSQNVHNCRCPLRSDSRMTTHFHTDRRGFVPHGIESGSFSPKVLHPTRKTASFSIVRLMTARDQYYLPCRVALTVFSRTYYVACSGSYRATKQDPGIQ